jgi:NAD(P)-dependent dehydrogenase (short-subunit alcohol dehydrogenase family)
MDLSLTDRVAVVTAAGSGIGLATVEALLAEGAAVVAADLNVAALAGHNVTACEIDLTEESAGDVLADRAITAHGRIDVLVNAVGGLIPEPDRFAIATDSDWRGTFELNLFTMVRVTRAVLPHMVLAGRGSIVSIASDAGRQPWTDDVDYAASKAAVSCVSKALSKRYGPDGIRSNIVMPGFTRTPATEPAIEAIQARQGISEEEAIAFILDDIKHASLHRLAVGDDVARVVVFLASDAAIAVTGSEYRVDSGIIAGV